jgi:trehalose-phosphatase
VSGRAAEDALRMAGIDGVWIVGNHGFELRTPAGQLTANQEAKEYETAISRAAHELTPLEQSVPGAIVENKRWGLSLHYRLVEPNAVAALSRRAEEIAHEFGLRLHSGKKMLELRPPVHVDKGTITVDLAERVGAFRQGGSIFYAGDDRTDEDAFRALRAREPRAVTARVLSAEDVAGENTDAEFMLQSVNELRQVLLWLEARRASTAHA